jgi:hypothetical protein
MKKSIFFLLLLTNSSFAQTWLPVGTPGFSNMGASYTYTVVAPNGVPYVIYRDDINSKAAVKKFDGTNWITVGTSGFSAGGVSCTTMAFDNIGTPYIAYTDWGNGYKATVLKFDGSNWLTIGTAGFTQDAASFTSIAIDDNGTPYIAFRDVFYNYRASVMKFDGVNWVYVGTPGFSSNFSFGGAGYTSLAIDASGGLYVVYSDHSNNYKATVMKFDGSNWISVGTGVLSSGASNNTSIAIDSQGSPYVGYEDGGNGNKATVKKFDGNDWVSVGLPGFSAGVAEYTSLSIDNNDVLYLAFQDYANSEKATVMTFNGTNWVTVGTAGFSASDAYYTTIAIDNNTGSLFVAFADGSTANHNATVMKYAITTGINEIKNSYYMNVFPNPTSRIITVNITSTKPTGEFTIKVSDSLGKTVYSEALNEITSSCTKQVDLSQLPKGIYFIELHPTTPNPQQKKARFKKIVLQ